MRPALPLAFMFLGTSLASGCADPTTTCLINCWAYVHEVSAPATCFSESLVPFNIPFTAPDANGYYGSFCPQEQATSNNVLAVLDAIEVGASPLPDVTDYNEVSSAVESDLLARCIASAPIADPGLAVEGCTLPSAESACATITDAADDALATTAGVLAHDGTSTKQIASGSSCDYEPLRGSGTGGDGGPPPADDGEPDDAGSGAPGFGDIDDRIFCDASGTWCTIASDLVDDVIVGFGIFYAEGVSLTLVGSSDPDFPGVRVGGLNRGEASMDLADALSLRNADVIKVVNGVTIETQDDALTAVDALVNASAVALEVERGRTTLLYRILVRE